MGAAPLPRALQLDPRYYQIAVLGLLLVYGMAGLDFQVPPGRVAVILASALAAQAVCTLLWRAPAFEPRSALISGLSLCLLLRTDSLLVAALAAALAVSSKFALRVRGKHLFNPTNFALVALLLFRAPAWVSPGQWGNVALFGFLLACLGSFVVNRAARSDVTFAFLASYAGLLLLRSFYLGERLAAPVHRMENGALILFAFFMISDPRTTPDSRRGRWMYAFLIALGAFLVQFGLFRTNGLLWSLAAGSLLVPALDRWLPGSRYEWKGLPLAAALSRKGVPDAPCPHLPAGRPVPVPGSAPGVRILRILRGPGGRQAL